MNFFRTKVEEAGDKIMVGAWHFHFHGKARHSEVESFAATNFLVVPEPVDGLNIVDTHNRNSLIQSVQCGPRLEVRLLSRGVAGEPCSATPPGTRRHSSALLSES